MMKACDDETMPTHPSAKKVSSHKGGGKKKGKRKGRKRVAK